MMATVLEYPVAAFLALTFGFALIPWSICAIASIDPFSEPRWMPLLICMVWAPTVAAVAVTGMTGDLGSLLHALLEFPRNPIVWGIACTPLLVALLVWKGGMALTGGPLLAFFAMHLLLGPLGEELGWRGFLLPRLEHFGPLGAPLLVGLIWGLWHAPLWWLNSPQSQIPFGIFLGMCVCFSMIMSTAHSLAPQSVLPAILFHWLVNATIGLLELNGSLTLQNAYSRLLPFYAAAAFLAGGYALYY